MNIEDQADSSPGGLLRAKRKELDISVGEIAEKLHLEARFIEALEQNNYAMLPGTTYVRGYMRAYAKAVDIDDDPVIALFDAEVVSDAPPEIVPEVRYRTQASSSDKPVKVVTYLVTLSLVMLVLIWYRSHYRVTDIADTNAVAQIDAPRAVSAPAFDYEFAIVDHPSGWQNMIERDNSNDAVLLPIGETRIDLPRFGPDELTMLISENSWIEISDATGKQLFISTGKAGEEITLSGNAPFDVLFGYAPGIKLFYKNQLFDTAPYMAESGVTRFKLND